MLDLWTWRYSNSPSAEATIYGLACGREVVALLGSEGTAAPIGSVD